MGKDVRLVNIYLKIHHKKLLTMDDLEYLAQYDPDCFMKTCKNVVYNIPKTESILEQSVSQVPANDRNPELTEQQKIEKILENLKHMELNQLSFACTDADRVKSLLGDLYMELLFPHNDKNVFIGLPGNENQSSFDKKV